MKRAKPCAPATRSLTLVHPVQILAEANATMLANAAAANSSWANGSNGSNGSLAGRDSLNATLLGVRDSFFYRANNQTSFCVEMLAQNSTLSMEDGAVESVWAWVNSTTPKRVAVVVYQLFTAANVTLGGAGGGLEQIGQRRKLATVDSYAFAPRAGSVQGLYSRNASSFVATPIQEVYAAIDADPPTPLLTISREGGAVFGGSLSAKQLSVTNAATLANLSVHGAEISAARDVLITPGVGKVVIDSVTVDDSTISSTDVRVPLVLESPAGVMVETDGDVVSSSVGSLLVDADSAELNLMSLLSTESADLMTSVHDTTRLSSGQLVSVTTEDLSLNAFGVAEASVGNLSLGVGSSAELAVLDTLSVSTTSLQAHVGRDVELTALQVRAPYPVYISSQRL